MTHYKNNKNLRAAVCFSVFLAMLLPAQSWAHAILVRSQPAKEVEITEAPKQIDVWFDDKVGSEFMALAVIDSTGKRVDNKDVAQETFNPAHLYCTVQPLTPGVYTVRYRVVSIDTHIVTGKFQFTIKAP
jgi:methionine-rich copper-binding protein CopC